MSWSQARLDWVADALRDTLDPSTLGDMVVDHFSIPALETHGGPDIVEASSIESGKQRVVGGEVLLSRLNPRKARVLRVPRASERFMLCSGEFIVLMPRVIEGRFLEYLLLSESTRQYLDGAVQSVTRSHQRVRPEVLTKMWISHPRPSEQRAIADFLDTETARIDALIAKKRRMIELLDERQSSLIDSVFGPSTDERLVRLGRSARVQTGVTVSASRATAPTDVEVPYLRVANVQHGELRLEEVRSISIPPETAARSLLQPGDVLMTEGGDIDKLGRGTVWRGEIANCAHQNHVFAVRVDPSKLLPGYLAAVTRTSHARAYFESTGVQSTNLASTSSTKVADFRVALPSVDRQRSACNHFESASSMLQEARTRLSRQLDLLAEHRQALITAAVTGESQPSEAA